MSEPTPDQRCSRCDELRDLLAQANRDTATMLATGTIQVTDAEALRREAHLIVELDAARTALAEATALLAELNDYLAGTDQGAWPIAMAFLASQEAP